MRRGERQVCGCGTVFWHWPHEGEPVAASCIPCFVRESHARQTAFAAERGRARRSRVAAVQQSPDSGGAQWSDAELSA